MKRLGWVVAAVMLTAGTDAAQGAILAAATGWYDESGEHLGGNSNYIVGGYRQVEYRSFFVFDLRSVSENIVDATLKIPNVGSNLHGPWTYTSYDILTPVSDLTATQVGRTDIFNDLGTGIVYASGSAPPSYGDYLVSLNTAGLAALNASKGGWFAIGGALSLSPQPLGVSNYTLSTASDYDNHTFAVTPAQGRPVELNLAVDAVPEPSTLLIWSLLGALGIAIGWWRRRKAA
jgi:hypothetical protein